MYTSFNPWTKILSRCFKSCRVFLACLQSADGSCCLTRIPPQRWKLRPERQLGTFSWELPRPVFVILGVFIDKLIHFKFIHSWQLLRAIINHLQRFGCDYADLPHFTSESVKPVCRYTRSPLKTFPLHYFEAILHFSSTLNRIGRDFLKKVILKAPTVRFSFSIPQSWQSCTDPCSF